MKLLESSKFNIALNCMPHCDNQTSKILALTARAISLSFSRRTHLLLFQAIAMLLGLICQPVDCILTEMEKMILKKSIAFHSDGLHFLPVGIV